MQDPFYLLSKCIYSSNPCLVALVDGEFDKTTDSVKRHLDFVNNKYFKVLDMLNHLTNEMPMFEFSQIVVVNATCHHNTMRSFKVQYSELPSLVYYSGSNENYYKFNKHDEFTYENVYSFVEKAKQGTLSSIPLARDQVNVNRYNCSKMMEHKDKSKKFDYGGREFEEEDSDNSNEINDIDSKFITEFKERYNKILEEEKRKADL